MTAPSDSIEVSPARLRGLSERADGPALVRAASHIGAAVGVGALIWWVRVDAGLLWALPLVVVQGFLVAFLFCALHECMHKTAFKTTALNVILGHAAGFAIALPFEYYTAFHWAHHRNTQDPDRDPELLMGHVPSSDAWLVIAFTGVTQLFARIRLMVVHAVTGTVRKPWFPKSQHRTMVVEARIYLLLYAVAFAGSIFARSPLLLWSWIVPLVIGQMFLRPYLYAEHTGCAFTRSAYENTRTTATTALLKWFSWNMPYHAEHHSHPTVPFHALPRLNDLIAERVVHQGRGYRAVTREVWAWFKSARNSA